MAGPLVERAWRESTPESVEADLAALWREFAGKETLARAVMSNLVVFRFRERRAKQFDAATSVDAALESVMALHPSRAIVIEHERGTHAAQGPSAAGVGVAVFGPPHARFGVERIVVRSACAEVSLPSIVRRFLHGDRPTSLWWTEDLSRVPPLAALVDLARQLVYDSAEWRDVPGGIQAVAQVAAAARVDVADLNWRRLDPLRRALAHAAADLKRAGGPVRVEITYQPGKAALAWLLGGWIVSYLAPRRAQWPAIEEAKERSEDIAVVIASDDATVNATLNGERVLVMQQSLAPIALPASRESAPEAVAAELRSLSRDGGLADALAAAAAASRGTFRL